MWQDQVVLLDRLRVPLAEFESSSGWSLKTQGACRGDVCVPLPPDAVQDGTVDVRAVAERLGMPLVHDAEARLWALGPETLSGHALPSAEAPELVLPTIDGDEFRMTSLRGSKVVLVAWAPY
jgi:hypothetical protein